MRGSLPSREVGRLPETEHLSEFLVTRVSAPDDTSATTADAEAAAEAGVAGGPVAYHDPCSLGRRAQVFDAPRLVIEKVTGSPPVEFRHSRESAECCGEGGLLPEVDPVLAARLADAQLSRLPEDVGTLITACPGCRAQLGAAAERAGGSVDVLDISELVADRLGLS
jgi:Fe-S oxidoreductase